jgi:hypothetical protein
MAGETPQWLPCIHQLRKTFVSESSQLEEADELLNWPIVSCLSKMERQSNHICIPYEIGYPTISNSRMPVGMGCHYLALHFWQTPLEEGAKWNSEQSSAF